MENSAKTSTPLVIVPAHNEEARIGSVVAGILRHVPDGVVLIINDGSNDRTGEAAQRAGAKVISHPYNLGYGAALQTGYRYALAKGYKRLVQMDGDGQHDPVFIPHLLSAVENGDTDVAIGSRFLPVGQTVQDYTPYKAPLLRRLGMGFFGTVASVIIGQKVTDPTSGYQAMNSRVLEWVSGDRFPFDYPDADVIIMLHRAGFRIREVPVRMFECREKRSMHSGWKPVYYIFKMFLSIFVTLLRK
jgi:glycosyltransferase involved in cell wall biosynthesis